MRQIRNVEFTVVSFHWSSNATADQTDTIDGEVTATSHAAVDGSGGTLLGHQRGGYNASQHAPKNAGGYTHVPRACEFHNGSGTESGMFVVSAHVPFTLNGRWTMAPDSAGSCTDSNPSFDPYVQGGFSQYGSIVKIAVQYMPFPSGGGASSGFPGDNLRCNPPALLGEYPGIDTATFRIPESKLLRQKRITLTIAAHVNLVSEASDPAITRTGHADVTGTIVLQQTGPLRCAAHVKCGAAPFRP